MYKLGKKKENITDAELEAIRNQILEGNLSLRGAAETLAIDKKQLKKLMQERLPEDLFLELQQLLDVNNKKNKPGDSKIGKKQKALQHEIYQAALQKLVSRQFQPEWLEKIYQRCKQNRHSMVSRDTMVYKLLEILEYFDARNQEVPNTKDRISDQDVVDMIIRNPRILSSNIATNFIAKCQIITLKKDGIPEANRAIRSNPGIFKKSKDDILKGR